MEDMNIDKLNADYEKWWAEEEKGLPPMFQGELSKQGLRALTKLAFQHGIISLGNQLVPKR